MSTDQLALRLRARRTDPGTSHQAAASMVRIAATQGDRIVAHLASCGVGLIYTEVAQALCMADVAVNRRLAELRHAGRVVRLPETRPTPSGRPAHVYVAFSQSFRQNGRELS